MKTIAIQMLITSAVWAVETPEINAKPIQFCIGGDLPSEIPFESKPMGFETGYKVVYLAQGADLSLLDEKSLKINSIKDGSGKEISMKRNGELDYELGSFPKVTDDGKYVIFSIESKRNIWNQTGRLNISGHITAFTSSDRVDSEFTLNLQSKEPLKINEFTVINALNEKVDKSDDSKAFFQAMLANSDSINVKVSGPINKIIKIDAYNKDEKLDDQGSSSDEVSKVFMFKKTAINEVRLKISYWKEFKEVKVKIEGEIGK